jgi:DNA-binding MarR family transcriptional regulator
MIKNKKEDIDEALMAFRYKITELFQKEAKKSGYSLTHFDILMYIAEKGSVTMKNIADWLHITPPSASSLIEKLVKKKLVRRIQSDNDRRTIEITLGGEGHKLFKFLHEKKIAVFKKMYDKLNNKEKEDLVRILNKCIN